MKRWVSNLIYGLFIGGVVLITIGACILIFAKNEPVKKNPEPIVTSYSLSPSKGGKGKYDLIISKTDDVVLFDDKKINDIDKIIIEDKFIDLPKEFLDKIKDKNITISSTK